MRNKKGQFIKGAKRLDMFGDKNPSWNPNIHHVICKCGCRELLTTNWQKNKGYRPFHSKEAINSQKKRARLGIKKAQKVLFEKYGTINPAQVPGAMGKREKTWINKYGVRNVGVLSYSPSSIELKIAELLKKHEIKFLQQYKVGGWAFDLAIPEKRILIECDGDYWHSLEIIKLRDKRKNAWCIENNFKLLRFTETEINDSIKSCENRLLSEVV